MPAFLTDRRILLGLLVLNALLKGAWLGVNDLSGDEPFTVFWATRGMADFWAMLRSENNPPLYFLLIKAWVFCVPLEEAWLRVPSALFSVLTVWPLYRLGSQLGDRIAATTACLFFTLSNHQYVFAHEVRAYSLLLLLTTLAAWSLTSPPQRGRARSTAVLAMVFAALVWTHFFGWLVIGLCGACVLVLPELRRERRRVVIAGGLAVLAFLPYGFIFLQRAGESITHGTWVYPHGPEEIWHMVRRWSNQPLVTLVLLLPLAVVLVRERRWSFALRFALLWWLLPLLGLWVVQWWVPAFVDRYLLFASIGFYLAVAFALVELVKSGPARWAAPVIAVVAMLCTYTPWKDNGRYPSRVAAQVRDWQRAPGDPPVFVRPFWYKLTLWAHLDRTRGPKLPWHDPWSERYDEAAISGSSQELILVYMASAADTGPPPAMDGWRQVEVRQCDGLTRVARYTR